ncbi:hypothetical protein KIW84_030669 [Lathyrus oleraceus]|uniref:Uncharacterized protein n=1 Tax=Pisum sativum TaxID=3888 RepID=A0A9D4XQB7_PEA|nr:hypothetical protein KIW84_030668 [Pisum sativum]KAI5424572.1 hypothetical protein KIW84_030669 [Pisum sativum]
MDTLPVNDALKVNDKSPNALSMLFELELKNDEWFAIKKRNPKLEATHLEKDKDGYRKWLAGDLASGARI